MNKILILPAGLVAFYAVHKAGILDNAFKSNPVKPEFDLESKQLYSYKKNETHCPDRDMIHPCTTELGKYLKAPPSENDSTYADKAYECTKTVYDTMNTDYFIIKNMTHLLLDLDVSTHKFDEDRANRFHKLGFQFARKLIHHPECMEEFDTKGEMECRCPHLYSKILLLKLKNAGLWDEAHALYSELKAFEWKGQVREYPAGSAFKWETILQTPQSFIPNLYSSPVWPKEKHKDLPIVAVLENNFEMIRDEIATLYIKGQTYDPAYRFLFKEGKWDQVLLFSGRKWEEDNCKLLPKICNLMKEELPKRAVHHYPWLSSQNEQVLILRVSPGTDMERHNGPANNILNVHLGVSGLEGAVLTIANKTYGWEVGKVIPWEGSFDHSVHCRGCKEDRVIMMVRYMHPYMTREHYRGMGNTTHFEAIPEGFADGEDAESGESD